MDPEPFAYENITADARRHYPDIDRFFRFTGRVTGRMYRAEVMHKSGRFTEVMAEGETLELVVARVRRRRCV